MSDDLSTLRANQAVLAGRIAALEARLSAADGVVDAVVYCGAEKPDYGAPHPCGLPDGHEGPHSCLHAYCTVTWPDPEPVPPGCPACDGVAGTACRCPEPNWGCDVADPHGNYYLLAPCPTEQALRGESDE